MTKICIFYHTSSLRPRMNYEKCLQGTCFPGWISLSLSAANFSRQKTSVTKSTLTIYKPQVHHWIYLLFLCLQDCIVSTSDFSSMQGCGVQMRASLFSYFKAKLTSMKLTKVVNNPTWNCYVTTQQNDLCHITTLKLKQFNRKMKMKFCLCQKRKQNQQCK